MIFRVMALSDASFADTAGLKRQLDSVVLVAYEQKNPISFGMA